MIRATYFLLAELKRRGIDGVFEQYGARRCSTDFRRGRRLGVRDHVIELRKPAERPLWMTPAQYAAAPTTLAVREVLVGGKLLVTTLLCSRQTPKEALKALYRQRWHAELDLRCLKTTLGMEMLSCRTPAMAMTALAGTPFAMNAMPGPEPMPTSMLSAVSACCIFASPPNAEASISSPCLAKMPRSMPTNPGAWSLAVPAPILKSMGACAHAGPASGLAAATT